MHSSIASSSSETNQRRLIAASPAEVYRALWTADLLESRLARALSSVAARRRSTRSAHLGDMLAPGSPWRLLSDEPHEVRLGLHWLGCDVSWALSIAPAGNGAVLTSRTWMDGASRRVRLLWPLIAPFAALLRHHVLRAVAREALRETTDPVRG
jgi:hypothetical protein